MNVWEHQKTQRVKTDDTLPPEVYTLQNLLVGVESLSLATPPIV